jgi:uncharacterized protein YxjI
MQPIAFSQTEKPLQCNGLHIACLWGIYPGRFSCDRPFATRSVPSLSLRKCGCIENDRGEKVFKVDGKALRVRQTLIFEDRRGTELANIQERMLRIKDSMEIEGPGGNQIAMVKKALIAPLRERWIVKIKGGPDLEVKGNILDHEYTIGEGRDKVAEVSKKWFRVRDTYGVEIEPGQDDILILAVTACIDQMAH